MVNPGEMHDGSPIDGVRGWHIVYLDPSVVRREVANDILPAIWRSDRLRRIRCLLEKY
ncbi:hypothetical protein AU825_22900 [Salmonella enterica subsp. salamae]|nr:hypothetical protein [Salmonella enterica subsp. salamae]